MTTAVQPDLATFLAAFHAASEPRRAAGLRAAMAALMAEAEAPAATQLLSGRKLAEKLDLAPSTVWRWQFPSVDWLGRKRYDLQQCLVYLQSDAYKLRRQEMWADRRRKSRRAAAKKDVNSTGDGDPW